MREEALRSSRSFDKWQDASSPLDSRCPRGKTTDHKERLRLLAYLFFAAKNFFSIDATTT
jgi:hypothetical protein